MKIHSAPLDDVFGELLLALDQDGGRVARIIRRVITNIYRAHKLVLLALLRFSWRQGALGATR